MKTLKITLATLSLTLFANFSMAQEATADEKAAKQTEAMAAKLTLTPDQKAQIADINLAIARKNEAVKNDAAMSEETKKQSYQGNKDARVQMIKPLLTPEQVKMFEEMEAQPTHVRTTRGLDFKQLEQKPATAEPVKN